MTVVSADEKAALAASVRAACDRLAPESRVRADAFDRHGGVEGFDADLWKVLCRQVGVAAIAIPESMGGAGYGAAAQAVIAHELGRVLAPVPFVASAVLATELLVAAGAPVELLRSLADGDITAAVVLTVDGGIWENRSNAVRARRRDNVWTLDGAVRHVLNGSTADQLVVVADVDGEAEIFVVATAEQGVAVTAENVLDRTRPMGSITFTASRAERLTPRQPVEELVGRCLHRALAVLSAEQVGVCERVLELATQYARTREQFGRAIGSFQAVKHRCANMLVQLEMARSASMAAVQSVDDDDDEAGWRASMAKAVCSEALREMAHENLQIHGGIGFTSEHAAGWFVKRARTDEVLFGRTGDHWSRLATGARVFA
ncbi:MULTISPECIES: acyl-CoA dehydrogenase [unclassified Mycobacterium]|uniref:acyl-CoA dehydrogenase family protein n=1 Tax=unclassified Mycobacterium TaxID=2642494 RepID=UPI0029C80F32|nr:MULTISPECIES: acyl-CoA dehydrogenase [unclassified Mycobacterium]